MIVPKARVACLAAAFSVPLLFLGWVPGLLVPVLAADAFLLLCCLLDRRKLRRADVRLVPSDELSTTVGSGTALRYRLENRCPFPVRAVLSQPLPDGWSGDGLPAAIGLEPGASVDVEFPATPSRRGRFALPGPEVRLSAAWGWCTLKPPPGPGARALVYPAGFGGRAAERMRRGRGMALLGIRRHRQVGSGSEFERLRTYEPDDDFRHLNWKATARAGKPISNVYQVERGRDVLVCLDTGRMMGQAAGEGTVLDAAAEAGLSLARAVTASGDRLGLVEFRDRVATYLPPRTGRTAAGRAAECVAAASAHAAHTSFAALAAAISSRQKRRALVIILTDLGDPQLAEDLAVALSRLRRRHAALVVGFLDSSLERTASAPAIGRAGLYRTLAASRLCLDRETAAREIRKLGVDLLETSGAELSARAVERYLRLKAGRDF